MLRNYLTIAFRNLLRNKTYTIINISGLSIALAFCLLASLFVYNERTYNNFHENADTIYRVYKEQIRANGEKSRSANLRMPVGPVLIDNIPDIKRVVRLFDSKIPVNSDGELFREKALFADASIFEVFSFSLKSGNEATALRDRYSVVISEKLARKSFQNENPIGKQISIQSRPTEGGWKQLPFGFQDFTITGVFKELPSNSSFQFDLLLPYENVYLVGLDATSWRIWGASNSTYVWLPEATNPNDVEKKFQPIVEEYIRRSHDKDDVIMFHLQPLTDVHLNTTIKAGTEVSGNPIYSYILAGIATLVFLVACLTCLGIVDTPRGSIFCRYRRCVYERSRNFTSEKAV